MRGNEKARYAGYVELDRIRRQSTLDPAVPGAAGLRAEAGGSSVRVPGLEVSVRGSSADLAVRSGVVAVATGEPRFGRQAGNGVAEGWLSEYERRGDKCFESAGGTFSVVIVDLVRGLVLGATDRFARRSLCYATEGSRFAFADRADAVPLLGARELDSQSLYDYLYFHVIPAPLTVFRGVRRLEAGEQLGFEADRLIVRRHWSPSFDERRPGTFASLKEEFRALLREAVGREAGGANVGTFLSGGTDSSTVAGVLGEVTGRPARTYSIGFDAEGYDEMSYARLAARHFGTDHHEYYVTPEDLIRAIPVVAGHFDQPFGNSSAVPAYCCAERARADGITRLLAGDGGDELFGGNTRYAKQQALAAYEVVPGGLRRRVIEPLLRQTPGLDRVPVVKKAASYIRQASVAMPDRLQAYNLLERLGPRNVLTGGVLAAIDPAEPLAQQREVYRACTAQSLVNRMLAYDWKYTLADSDLPKVCGATELADVAVGFPLLADEIVDFSLRLAPELKLKRLKLRYFFKEALRGFLPDEILAKRKHGFGLPFGVWLTRHDGLRGFVFGILENLKSRGLVRADFLDRIRGEELRQHPGYFGEMVWILMMLELWLGTHQPGWRVT